VVRLKSISRKWDNNVKDIAWLKKSITVGVVELMTETAIASVESRRLRFRSRRL